MADHRIPERKNGPATGMNTTPTRGRRRATRHAEPERFPALGARVQFGPGALRAAAAASLVVSLVIVVGGGIVRVTGSGLGCPDWPTCAEGSLAPAPEMGSHAVIEFANRLLTGVVVVVVTLLVVVSRFQREPRPGVTRWAWAQFWVVVLNAAVGGLTVLAELNPYIVAAHFLAAVLLLAAATVTWDTLDRHRPGRDRSCPPGLHGWARVLLTAGVLLLLSGTVVTGSGPHAGDSADVPRMGFDWAATTWIHAFISGVVVLAAAKIRWPSPPGSRMRSHGTRLLVLLAVQAGVGILQSLTGLPNAVVVAHMLGAALIVIGAIRITLETTQHSPARTGDSRQENQ